MISLQAELKPGASRDALENAGRKWDLVLVFGPTHRIVDAEFRTSLSESFPSAVVAGCSTAGQITRGGVLDDDVTLTCVRFGDAGVRCVVEERKPGGDREVGRLLARRLAAPDLKYVMVLSEGLRVVAQDLVDGLVDTLDPAVRVSGGLAGDGTRFSETVLLQCGEVLDNHVLAVGFFGSALQARCASASGWLPFGKPRTVTRAEGNVVYELDHQKALDVYERYLGDEAKDLPAAGLVYPISVRVGAKDEGLIRSLSAVNREDRSLTFFGRVPEGSVIHLMNAGSGELIRGAETAVARALEQPGHQAELALLFSCVGRKAVMGRHTELEVEAVVERLPASTMTTGFHTYGEIGYYQGSNQCEHHNQTMTVTLLGE